LSERLYLPNVQLDRTQALEDLNQYPGTAVGRQLAVEDCLDPAKRSTGDNKPFSATKSRRAGVLVIAGESLSNVPDELVGNRPRFVTIADNIEDSRTVSRQTKLGRSRGEMGKEITGEERRRRGRFRAVSENVLSRQIDLYTVDLE